MADIRSDITKSGELGFGSPSFSGEVRRDAGFGAPTFITSGGNNYTNVFETGFGDPFLLPDIKIEDKPPPPARQLYNKLADNGGELLRILGDFSSLRRLYQQGSGSVPLDNVALGPFTVKFHQLDNSDVETGVVYECESAIPSLRNNLYTNQQQNELIFTTPVMPKGNYICRIRYSRLGRSQDLGEFEVVTRLRYDKTMSIRHNLPGYWDKGQTSDGYDASGGYIKGQDSSLDTMIQSWGEGFSNLYNTSYTVTTAEFNLSDNGNLYVETSLGFDPDGGRIIIEDGEYEYSGVSRDPSDNNVHFLTGVKQLVRGSGYGSRQHDLENPKIYAGLDQLAPHEDIFDPVTNLLSVDQGPDEPIILKGSRVYISHFDFSAIDLFYKLINTGFRRPALIKQENFERAYNRVEYGERELMRVIFEYFYELFKQLNVKIPLKANDIEFRAFQTQVGSPDAWIVGSDFYNDEYQPVTGVIYDVNNNRLNCSHVQRLCRINRKFYFIKSRFIDNANGGNYQLDDRGCAYWNGMTPQLAQDLEDANVADVDIEILPWIIFKDHGGRFHIRFERTCFRGIDSFIDKDFIDFSLFISGLNGEEELGNEFNRNLNFMIMTAANIDDKIHLHQRCASNFGSYLNPNFAPSADIYVEPIRNLI